MTCLDNIHTKMNDVMYSFIYLTESITTTTTTNASN